MVESNHKGSMVAMYVMNGHFTYSWTEP